MLYSGGRLFWISGTCIFLSRVFWSGERLAYDRCTINQITNSAPAIRGSLLRCLLPFPYHSELEFQQVWLGAAGSLRVLPVPFVKGLTALVERVDHILAPFLLECVFLEAVCRGVSSQLRKTPV